jgi:hypothetical protein
LPAGWSCFCRKSIFVLPAKDILLLAEETVTVLLGIEFGGPFLQICCVHSFFTFGVNEKPLVLPTEVKGFEARVPELVGVLPNLAEEGGGALFLFVQKCKL